MRIHPLASVAIAISLLAGACAAADAAAPPRDEPVDESPDASADDNGDEPGLGDDGSSEDDWADEFPTDAAREDARGFLGMFEADLPAEVRIARRGEETFMLTEDYALGRSTVQLDDDGDGFRVVSVTVELPDGPETFDLEAS